MHADESYIIRALAAGARAYLLKDATDEDLIPPLRAVAAGKPFFSPSVTGVLIEDYVRQLQARGLTDSYHLLTDREREVLQLLAEGRSNKEVAALLDVGVSTVETHRANLMQKLNLHNTAEIVLYAVASASSSRVRCPNPELWNLGALEPWQPGALNRQPEADQQQHVDDKDHAQTGRADETGQHRTEREADQRRRRHDAESGDVRVCRQQRTSQRVGSRHRHADPEAGDDQRERQRPQRRHEHDDNERRGSRDRNGRHDRASRTA